jgi:GNAT superfamily N-acetyltransferase
MMISGYLKVNLTLIWHEPDERIPWWYVQACVDGRSMVGNLALGKLEIEDVAAGTARIFGVSVHESYSGRGIATEMHERVFTEMFRRGFKKVRSDSAQTEGGHAIWKKLLRTYPDAIRECRSGDAIVPDYPLGLQGYFLVDLHKFQKATKQIAYHWTNTDNFLSILKTGMWWGGSATIDPHYKFEKGEGYHDAPDLCLIFDSSDFEERIEIIMGYSPLGPFRLEESEVYYEGNIRLDDKRFIGLGARTEKDCEWIQEKTRGKYKVTYIPLNGHHGFRCDTPDCPQAYGHDGDC